MYNKTATDLLNEKFKDDLDVRHFLNKFEAYGSISNRMHYRYRRVNYNDWMSVGSPMPISTDVEQEPMIEITLPQHKFKELLAQEDYLERLEQSNDYNQKVVNMLRADERVRDDNPAVKNAWKKYLMLLELARK